MSHPFDQLMTDIGDFVAQREWQQFHDPKNMAICLSVEANELLEHYTWTRTGPGPHPPGTEEPSVEVVQGEVADVFLCLVNFCSATGIDLVEVTRKKLATLGQKYPVNTARGSAVKGSLESQ